MGTDGKKNIWVQCQKCGKIHRIRRKLKVDQIYVTINCSRCGKATGLNLGDDKDQIYEYYNVNIDPRYY